MNNQQRASITPPNLPHANGGTGGDAAAYQQLPAFSFSSPPQPQQLYQPLNPSDVNTSNADPSNVNPSNADNNTTLEDGRTTGNENSNAAPSSTTKAAGLSQNQAQNSSGIGDFSLPGYLICPFSFEPPPDAVYLINLDNENIRRDGGISLLVQRESLVP